MKIEIEDVIPSVKAAELHSTFGITMATHVIQEKVLAHRRAASAGESYWMAVLECVRGYDD